MQRSLIDVYSFKPLAVNALTQAFGDRLKCVGLQGSYLRGEATPDSDIDLLIILDDVNIDDLDLLRTTLRSIPDGNRAVGFTCGRQQMASWPLYELFQFAKGTEVWHGNLENQLPRLEPRDTVQGAHISVSSLYHLTNHTFLSRPDDVPSHCLPGLHLLYKNLFFSLQLVEYLRSGRFVPTKQELLDTVVRDGRPDEATMMRLSLADEAITRLIEEQGIRKPYEWLLDWSRTHMMLFR